MKSIVASVAVGLGNKKELVFDAVEKAMNLASWKRYVKGETVLLKTNAVWDKVYPCAVTSPMVLEGVLRMVKKYVKPKKIIIADTIEITHFDFLYIWSPHFIMDEHNT